MRALSAGAALLAAALIVATGVQGAAEREGGREPRAVWPEVGAEAAPGSSGAAPRRSFRAGVSVRRRTLTAVGSRAGESPVRVLVVGSIHGNEAAGHDVVRRLRRLRVPDGIELWTLRSANPDGVDRATRQNARGVDLNRNFPLGWRRHGKPFSTYHSGPRPLSEPEARAVRRLVRALRPDVTIWYHQALRLVALGGGADPVLVRGYARRVGLPARQLGYLPGVATRWQNARFPGTSAFVVELAAGPLPAPAVAAHARAVLAVARIAARRTARRSVEPPAIERRRIPFGPVRKRQMRRYARRHYGIDDHRLLRPRLVVLHLSVSDTAESVIHTFSRNVPDPELGELPGVCAHYVIDPSGRVLELVSRRLMCRHTVGLNHVSFGIEHVGRREQDVFRRRRQLRASLALTRWLQSRYGLRTRDVIGHNESLRSPYHRERVARLRHQTHADFPRGFARRYRVLLEHPAGARR